MGKLRKWSTTISRAWKKRYCYYKVGKILVFRNQWYEWQQLCSENDLVVGCWWTFACRRSLGTLYELIGTSLFANSSHFYSWWFRVVPIYSIDRCSSNNFPAYAETIITKITITDTMAVTVDEITAM